MAVVFITHERYLDHDPGRGHPERRERLQAVLDGVNGAGLSDALIPAPPRPATRAEVERAHTPSLFDLVERVSAAGGGFIDADTTASADSFDAAVLAAGAGLAAVEMLDEGAGEAAFCAVRPPGHHATPGTSMGFCLFNNVAITAAALAERGERVLIVDFDAHHGNGTQDIFWTDPRVMYVSLHQHPLYPGTGGMRDAGGVGARGTTINLPLPPGATGDVYRAAIDEVIRPASEAFDPTWLLLSAGFDAHRADPLTDLGLSAGDFGDITAELQTLAAPGRRIAFLEGGYDLDALATGAAACVGALVGERVAVEPSTAGGPGHQAVSAVALLRAELTSGAASD